MSESGRRAAAVVVMLVQHRLERKRDHERALGEKVTRMRTLEEVARSVARNARYLQRSFPDRETFHLTATGHKPFNSDAVTLLSDPVSAVPLHELDTPTMVFEFRVLTALTRDMKAKLEVVLEHHERLDGEQFGTAIASFESIATACEEAVMRIKDHVDVIDRERRVPLESPTRRA
jgi:hypothetical protein